MTEFDIAEYFYVKIYLHRILVSLNYCFEYKLEFFFKKFASKDFILQYLHSQSSMKVRFFCESIDENGINVIKKGRGNDPKKP